MRQRVPVAKFQSPLFIRVVAKDPWGWWESAQCLVNACDRLLRFKAIMSQSGSVDKGPCGRTPPSFDPKNAVIRNRNHPHTSARIAFTIARHRCIAAVSRQPRHPTSSSHTALQCPSPIPYRLTTGQVLWTMMAAVRLGKRAIVVVITTPNAPPVAQGRRR